MAKKRILIVEDDRKIAELERDYLEANGYEAELAHNGTEALKKLGQTPFALALLDIMLPGMDGFELCKKIRENSDIPLLFVSAKKEDIDKIRGLWIGADDYIVKPFSPSELVARVHSHIARYDRLTEGDSKKSPIIRFGALSIDGAARRVFVEENEVSLTNKEFDVLFLLASNPNIVFSKDELFNRIWSLEALGETSTVTVHINRIREKIEDNSADPKYIETVWGIGYRFKMPG